MQLQIQVRVEQDVTHGSGPMSSLTISTSTNRVTALGGNDYYYDANGSLTQDDLFKYKYDAENRVVEIRNLSDTLLTSYAYDGHSMQVIKVASGTRTWFLYAGGQLVSEYYDAASNTYSSPTSPGSAPADTASTLLYQHSDHLTTRVTTDNAGTLSNQQAHYPYGENWYATGTADPSVTRKFTSYRKEGGSLASGQINYAVARYHGARIGRFHRPDPVRGNFRNPQRLNRYAYVTNNPVRYTDPRGLDMVDPANAEGFSWAPPQGQPTPLDYINSRGESFQTGSLLARRDILPSLSLSEAMDIYFDPDDGDGYDANGNLVNPGENDAWSSWGYLSTNGVVTINVLPNINSRNPMAGFMNPNPQPTINIGQTVTGPVIWTFATGGEEPSGLGPLTPPVNPWAYPSPPPPPPPPLGPCPPGQVCT